LVTFPLGRMSMHSSVPVWFGHLKDHPNWILTRLPMDDATQAVVLYDVAERRIVRTLVVLEQLLADVTLSPNGYRERHRYVVS
jgi:hypothetical protein